MPPKKILFYLFICLPAVALAQWPLKVLSSDDYIYAIPAHILLSKVKYTTKGQIGALFNYIDFPRYDNITIDGDYGNPSDYKSGNNSYIYFLRNAPGSRYGGNGNEQSHVHGSSYEYGVDFETDADDNFILLGNNVGNNWSAVASVTVNPRDSTQILLCKTGDQNKILWNKLYGGSSAEYAVSIQKAGDGNFLVLAQTQSGDGDVKASFGGKDIWLFKIDTDGNMLWQKTFGSSKDEIPAHMEVLQDGSIVISGSADQSDFAPSAYGGKNAFLLKLTSSGDKVWIKTFGGSGDDKIKSFTPVPGGFVSIGTSSSTDGDYPDNTGKDDIYVMKHDVAGAIVWKKHYGDINNEQAGDIVYTSCDDKIFASYAKEFSGGEEYVSDPPYPLYSQNAGVQLGLLNSSGAEFYHYEDNFRYSQGYATFTFNNAICNTMAANNKGGFLAGSHKHMRYGDEAGGVFEGEFGRSFHIEEYGIPLTKKSFDTSLCEGSSAYGNTFTKDTIYSDTLRNACGIDTLITSYQVKVTSTADSLVTKDTTICYGEAFEGTPVTSSFTASSTVNLATACGFKKIITTSYVKVPPLLTHFLGNDTLLCKEGLVLRANVTGTSYLWQDGSVQSSLAAGKSGLYWEKITDKDGCKSADSINISITDLFLTILHDTTIDAHKSVWLTPSTNGTVTWQHNSALNCENCQQTLASPSASTTFYLTSRKGGCTITDFEKVNVKAQDYFYLPNAFTPNGDGLNDVFKPKSSGITAYAMQIYNRWGEVVFQTKDAAQGWDGNIRGLPQHSGVYIYKIKYKNSIGKEASVDGTFLLLQ